MAKHVFVLGAGASAEAGAPMMSDFLDVAEVVLAEGSVTPKGGGPTSLNDKQQEAFRLVFKGISHLKRAHSNAALDVDNIESVLGAFEAARLFGKLGDLSATEVVDLPGAVRALIVDTLERRFEFDYESNFLQPPGGYRAFGRLIAGLHDRGDSVAIITFNYDLGIDHALEHAELPIDYGFDPAITKGTVPLLKLHGSLNWSRPRDPEKAHVITRTSMKELLRHYNGLYELHGDKEAEVRKVYLHFSEPIVSTFAKERPSEIVIVPPTWTKMVEYQAIAPVWKAAAKELETAENVLISGFSLPPTDTFFPMLFALGTIGDTRIKNVVVYDKYVQTIEDRYRRMLGSAAVKRFSPKQADFSVAAAAHIPNLLKVTPRTGF